MSDLTVIDSHNAKLPQSYERAKKALSNCSRIDECMEWENKAEALASYAKQADDKTLENYARRIRERASRRTGELLKQFDGKGKTPGNQYTGKIEKSNGDITSFKSQKEVAEQAGLSVHRARRSKRLANIPEDEFDELIDSEDMPTRKELEEIGTRSIKTNRPEGFKEATKLMGKVRDFSDYCSANNPELVANGLNEDEAKEVKSQIHIIDSWLDKLIVNLK